MKKLRIALPLIGLVWLFVRAKDLQSFFVMIGILIQFSLIYLACFSIKCMYDIVKSKRHAEHEEVCRQFENAKGSPPRPPPPTPQRPK